MICACVNPSSHMPELLGLLLTDPQQPSNLCRDSILDLAVDSAELLVEGLLRVIDDAANALIKSGLLSRDTSLVPTFGKDLGVIGGTATVPSQKLR